MFCQVAPPFVIPSEAEGPAVPPTFPGNVFDRRATIPTPTSHLFVRNVGMFCQSCHPLCHPERSRGTCGSADLSWECFRSARNHSNTHVSPFCQERWNVLPKLPPPLSSRAKPRDLRFRRPFLGMFSIGAQPFQHPRLTFLSGTLECSAKVATPFVIPSEAEGPAVPQTFPGNVFDRR